MKATTATDIRRPFGTLLRPRPLRQVVTAEIISPAYERTIYEAGLDLDYAIRLSELHARLFARLKRFVTMVGLVAGSAAFVAIIGERSGFAAFASLVVALFSALDLVYDFASLSGTHQRDKEAFLRLRSRVSKLTLTQIDAEMDRIKATAASTIDALDMPAYNENLMRHGRPECMRPLTRWQKLVRFVA